ncbi:hypothetical protein ACVWYQ_003450 [Bradyrhizobium sp. USDA 3397]
MLTDVRYAEVGLSLSDSRGDDNNEISLPWELAAQLGIASSTKLKMTFPSHRRLIKLAISSCIDRTAKPAAESRFWYPFMSEPEKSASS